MPIPEQKITVRKATLSDSEAILDLVRGLAEYEKLSPPDAAAQKRLIRDMFSDPPRISALLAEADGAPVGYAFYFFTYSSFLALPTLYLEDLFVLPDYRKKRAGLTLFQALVIEAVRLGCGRMEWTVLDWNALAIDFYRRLGAKHMKEWHLYRLTRDEMLHLNMTFGTAP
jgi:GNAT superfamily N-acetyltransferase